MSFSSFTNLFCSSSFFLTSSAFAAFAASLAAFLSPFLLGFLPSSPSAACSLAGYSFFCSFFCSLAPSAWAGFSWAGLAWPALTGAGFTIWTVGFLAAGGASLSMSCAHLKWDTRLYHAKAWGWICTFGTLLPRALMASLSASPGCSPLSHWDVPSCFSI